MFDQQCSATSTSEDTSATLESENTGSCLQFLGFGQTFGLDVDLMSLAILARVPYYLQTAD